MVKRFNIPKADSVKLLVDICLSNNVTNHGQIANILGQVEHETKYIYAEEINGRANALRLGYKGGAEFFGRGYIQITHDYNYRKFGELLGLDLYNNRDLATEPEIAARIAVIGMRDGLFTGLKLSDYVNNSQQDFFNARRTVNGLDKASTIQDLSIKWLLQVPRLVSGSDPDPNLFVDTPASNNNSFLFPNKDSLNQAGALLRPGVCLEAFPVTYTMEEALTYTGCISKLSGAGIGASSNNYPPLAAKVIGGTSFDLSDFDPNSPICPGCFIWPFERNVRVSSPFCQQRRSSNSGRIYFHSGTDFAGNQGEPVLAIADGTVINPLIAGDGYNPGFVDIVHERYGNIVSRSAHIIPSVTPGTKVKQGQPIGVVGPYPSGGPHLHLELRKDKGAGGSVFSVKECNTKLLDPALYCRRN